MGQAYGFSAACQVRFVPGIARQRLHRYKGGSYSVICEALHSETHELRVVYRSEENGNLGRQGVNAGTVVSTTANHYATLRMIEDALGIYTHLDRAAGAPGLKTAFGL